MKVIYGGSITAIEIESPKDRGDFAKKITVKPRSSLRPGPKTGIEFHIFTRDFPVVGNYGEAIRIPLAAAIELRDAFTLIIDQQENA